MAVLDGQLLEEAERVAGDFYRVHKNMRNPDGKEAILIYGGDYETREKFAYEVRRALPVGIRNPVLTDEEEVALRSEKGKVELFLFNLNEFLERINTHPQSI